MAKITENNFNTQLYSEVPWVRASENRQYLNIVKTKIKHCFDREKLVELYNQVYMHQLLEGTTIPQELMEIFTKEAKFYLVELRTPANAPQTEVKFDKYSIIPSKKQTQYVKNTDLLNRIARIQEMNADEVAKEYIKVLETAQNFNTMPDANLLRALEKRARDLVRENTEIRDRLEYKLTSSDNPEYRKEEISMRKSNYSITGALHSINSNYDKACSSLNLLNSFSIRTTFSSSRRTRNIEIADAIDFVSFGLKHRDLFERNPFRVTYHSEPKQRLQIYESEIRRLEGEKDRIKGTYYAEMIAKATEAKKEVHEKEQQAIARREEEEARRKAATEEAKRKVQIAQQEKERKEREEAAAAADRRRDEAAGLSVDPTQLPPDHNTSQYAALHNAPSSRSEREAAGLSVDPSIMPEATTILHQASPVEPKRESGDPFPGMNDYQGPNSAGGDYEARSLDDDTPSY